jgi:uncharacterized protein DUF1629
LIEQPEPGVHEFFAVRLKPKNPAKIPVGMDRPLLVQPYFLLNIQTRLGAVCIEKSDVVVTTGGLYELVQLRQTQYPVKVLTLLKSMIAGHHLWKGRYQFTRYTFCSDALAERIQKLRGKYIIFENVDEI